VNRRGALALLGAGCVFCRVRKAVSASTLPPYCSIDPTIDLNRYRARSSTGDKRLDRALIAELRSIMQVLPVNPGFRIIDDVEGPNAFALDRTLVANTQGTVLFGTQLMTEELDTVRGGNAVAGIAAHECAHIFQYFSRFGDELTRNQDTARTMELHADFLAGYYLGRDGTSTEHIDVFAESLYRKGDWDFNSQHHHGTPDERVDAMERGYALADSGLHIEEIAERGIEHVL
jgi:hypothetical protein